MIIDCIGCLHGYYPKLEGGDLLIVTGDLTARDTQTEHMSFFSWIAQQKYKKKIWIAGNHDNFLQGTKFIPIKDLGMEYLCDSGTEYQDLKIWGSPYTKKFEGQNPYAMAFCLDTDEELEEKWSLIPDDTDILITHGPPYGILDGIPIEDGSMFHVGCKKLRDHILRRLNLKLHIFSHIHEDYGKLESYLSPFPGKVSTPTFINCSIMDEKYRPVNKPVRIQL